MTHDIACEQETLYYKMALLLKVATHLILVQISRYRKLECDETVAMTVARSIFDMPWNFKTFHCNVLKVHIFSREPRLYKSVSVCRSVGPSVGWSVGRLVRQSVGLLIGLLVGPTVGPSVRQKREVLVARWQTTYFVCTNFLSFMYMSWISALYWKWYDYAVP